MIKDPNEDPHDKIVRNEGSLDDPGCKANKSEDLYRGSNSHVVQKNAAPRIGRSL